MTARTLSLQAGLGFGLALVLAGPALAQDPPARVGRIAYVAGPVSFAPAGAADWAQAPLNRPLVAGDRLWTDARARDEVQFGSAIARMDARTLVTVLAADERTTQLQLSEGRIELRVRALAPGETVEVDTPNLAFVARQPGEYRVAVAPDGGTTDVTVVRGAADAYGDGTALALNPGQGYRFAGQDLNNYVLRPLAPPDDFVRWAQARDGRYERAVARRYVPQGLVGAEDLDDYGSWREVPDYGTVWVPDRAPRNWAPYHTGHWSWIEPWGWTWIDDQPYGYAVSHYGRWVRTPDTWAWVPAPVQARPVYAPAVVAFVGTALAIGSWSGPGVGWFPLAPHEPYRPPYHASPTYVTNVNVTNTVIRQTNVVNVTNVTKVTHINNININDITYRNRTVPGAMVAMPAQQFAQAAPTARAGMLLPPGVARAAPLLARPDARPLPHSRIGTGPAPALPPAPVLQRVAVARAMPAAAFVHAGGPVAARPGMPPAAHGGVPPLRMLRPAHGQPAAPRPGTQLAGGPDMSAQGRPAPGQLAHGGQGGALSSGVPERGAAMPPLGHLPVGPVPHGGDPAGRMAGQPHGVAPERGARGPALPPAVRPGVDVAHDGRNPMAGPRFAAHGVMAQPPGAQPQPAGGAGGAMHLPHDGAAARPLLAAQAEVSPPQVMGHPAAPQSRPQRGTHASEAQPQFGPERAAHGPAPQPRAQPDAHVAAPDRYPQPAHGVHASAPQPAAHAPAPQPAPHAAPRHEPPHEAPHPQPHPQAPTQAHGPDKGGEHGHGHEAHGGH